MALVEGWSQAEWEKLEEHMESLGVVWPFLFQVADDLASDHELGRAIGELLLFAVDSEKHMEKLWWEQSKAYLKEFARKWASTDRAQYQEWEAAEGMTPPIARVRAHVLSRGRAAVQEEERKSGSVFPCLEAVRPFTWDCVAARLQKKKAAEARAKLRVKAGAAREREGKKRRREDENAKAQKEPTPTKADEPGKKRRAEKEQPKKRKQRAPM